MQDLRLVGVHDDGNHLLLSGTGGATFRLPLDEALRTAVSRATAKTGPGSGNAPITMSPRDIQSRIRSGATAADVAELSGIPLAKVQRYEGPVLAEREHIAGQARKVEVAAPAPGHDAYRSVFGDHPASLEDMVKHRLTAHGVEPATLEWDSWRRPDGSWNVVARFEPKPGGPSAIGEEPPAMWTFNPARKSLQNANRWAQQLSELEPLEGPVPARRLSAVSDRPFDFETDADAAARTAAEQHSMIHQLLLQQDRLHQERDASGLLDMLRSRRGQRMGMDEDADDALAMLMANSVPAAHPRPSEVTDVTDESALANGSDEDTATDVASDAPVAASAELNSAELNSAELNGAEPAHTDPDDFASRRDARSSVMSRLSLAPSIDDSDTSLTLHDGVSTETREITIEASQLRPIGQSPASTRGLDELLGGGTSRRQQREAQSPAGGESETGQPERQPGKPKRSSVPSWDEIVFGTRGD